MKRMPKSPPRPFRDKRASAPLISVIIPHLNQPDRLRCCLTSLQAQSFDMEKVEIIVVDNGSKVLPIESCKAFGVELFQEITPGPGPARNRGVSLSRGQILAFIDADCVADPDWLMAIATEMEKTDGSGILGGDVRIELADPAKLTALEAYESIFAYRQKDYIEKRGFSGTGNLAVRRQILETVGPFSGIELAEDRDWGQRARMLGHHTQFAPRMRVLHPARRSFAELRMKWDRVISHDFKEHVHGRRSKLRWFLLAIAVAMSPMGEPRGWRSISICLQGYPRPSAEHRSGI